MAIFKTAGGRYKVILDVEAGRDAPRKRQSYGVFRLKKDALAKEREILDRKAAGYSIARSKLTLQDLVDRYLTNAAARDLSPVSLHTYRAAWLLRLRDRIGHLRADKLQPIELQTVYDELRTKGGRGGAPLAGRTVRDLHGFVHAVLAWAVRMELLTRNVADAVEAPRAVKKRAATLTPSEAAAVLLAAKERRFGPLAMLVLATGMRRGELAALKWSDVDVDGRRLIVSASTAYIPRSPAIRKSPKSGKVRTVPLNELAIAALRRQRAQQAAEQLALGEPYVESGFVFTTLVGNPYKPNALYRGYREIAMAAGVAESKLHVARHTASSFMLAAGIDPTTVASIIGHEQPTTTLDIYGHALEAQQRVGVAAIDERFERTAKEAG